MVTDTWNNSAATKLGLSFYILSVYMLVLFFKVVLYDIKTASKQLQPKTPLFASYSHLDMRFTWLSCRVRADPGMNPISEVKSNPTTVRPSTFDWLLFSALH